ncbi:MAG: Xaa-Pro peptidase family protein [Methanolinea sp.]|nr:Xaa-Pro peptidase family protein [Methanolinea sp.]
MRRFRERMDLVHPGWELSVFFGRVNLYYFTGTIQDGMLLVPRDGREEFWVRRSYRRALAESEFPVILPMESFRDAAVSLPRIPKTAHIEANVVPVGLLERFRKYFPVRKTLGLDPEVAWVRARKTPYEISLLRRAGEIHRLVLEEDVPALLREGMSEAALATGVYGRMVSRGHEGIVRFGSFNTEIEVGQVAFGENSLYPTCFNGPGGCRGMGPAAPVLGDPARKLARGDLVFIDNACMVGGYQTDKTMTYVFCGSLPRDAREVHERCVEIAGEMASMLVPGAVPSRIYSEVTGGLEPEFLEHFMGDHRPRVRFLGHGVGLVVDEPPVIAPGFDEPLEEGMAIALEPKYAFPGVGLLGVEDTYLVTPRGGVSITGENPGPVEVG